jgi:hypothetical protein
MSRSGYQAGGALSGHHSETLIYSIFSLTINIHWRIVFSKPAGDREASRNWFNRVLNRDARSAILAGYHYYCLAIQIPSG